MNHGNILMHSSGRAKKRFDDMCGAQQFVAGYTAQELRISASGQSKGHLHIFSAIVSS